MGHGLFIVTLVMCSQVAIGHRHGSKDLKHLSEWERNTAELDPQSKRGIWRIEHPIDYDGNEYDSSGSDSSEYDSMEWGGYHGGHHGHHGYHSRYSDWESDSRNNVKPRRKPVLKKISPTSAPILTSTQRSTKGVEPGLSSDPSTPIKELDKGRSITISPKRISQCIINCPKPADYDPVCGTDDVTYNNSGHLLCAQFCGLDVKPKKIAACSSAESRTTPLPSTIQACVNNCPTSPIQSPVCGSNGVIYRNSMHLLCHRICGVDVQVVPCTTDTDNGGIGNDNVNTPVPPTTDNSASSDFVVRDCIKFCPQTSEYNPVCGTNNVTYRNPGHLACAQLCGVSVETKRKSACAPRVVTTEAPNKGSSASKRKEENGVTVSKGTEAGSTIPPDVLQAIFNYTTTTKSEDFNIDPRFRDH